MLLLDANDWAAIRLTLQLATTTTVLLVIISTPLAWWLAHSRSFVRNSTITLVALPLVLPPTVLGFYLLILLGPEGPIQSLGGPNVLFSFTGLVIASMIYSLPFVVQPLVNGFESMDKELLHIASTLRATPWDRFRSIILPLNHHHYLTAIILGFAHTLGEFGVILMIGGSIPGKTEVISIALFNHVEAFEYGQAHQLALITIILAIALASLVFRLQGQSAATKNTLKNRAMRKHS